MKYVRYAAVDGRVLVAGSATGNLREGLPRSGRIYHEAYRGTTDPGHVPRLLINHFAIRSWIGVKAHMTDVNNTDVRERMRILNAYYFPDQKYGALSTGISPVNSFRVVLNEYIRAHLELLPDRSFFSTWGEPYHFIDVTDEFSECRSEAVSVNR